MAAWRLPALALLLLCCAACDGERTPGTRVFLTVYSAIDEQRLAPLFAAFEADSGIRVNQVRADDERLLDLLLEKSQSPVADLYLADGVAKLARAAEHDVFRPVYQDALELAIPAALRDDDKRWFGLSQVATAIVVDPRVVAADEQVDYVSLGDSHWRGRLCLTSSASPGNAVVIANLIERFGVREAELSVRAWIANLALAVRDSEADLLGALRDGRCAVGLARFDAVADEPDGVRAALEVRLPGAEQAGTVVDVVGAGVTRHAANAEAAAKLLSWLAGERGQTLLREQALGLPVAAPLPLRGTARQPARSHVPVYRLGLRHPDALALAERARYP